jgi:DNA-binding transcriptional ArsR family regulator
LIEFHPDELPASVIQSAQSTLLQPAPSSQTEEIAVDARDALSELDPDNPAWGLLQSIARTPAERRSYPSLYADDRFDISDNGIRKQIQRLRDAGLVETRPINGDQNAVLTPTGYSALQQHPTITIDTDVDTQAVRSSPGCGGNMENTSQAQSHDGSGADDAVTNPRNHHDSTVYSQHAHEGLGVDGPVETDEAAGSPRDRSDAPQLSAEFAHTYQHHAAAAAAEEGQFALCSRSLSDDVDRRKPTYSYCEDRDEIYVSVWYSPIMGLLATRLCAALLSDHAFEQVLTEDRLNGGPGDHSLHGLAISNPYVLRKGACIGWLRDVDQDGGRFRSRLENARRELLAMTGDINAEDGSIDEESLSNLLSKAHGLMGVAIRVYDMLGLDIIREIKIPNRLDAEERDDLRTFLAYATSITSRYGVYSAHRVLYENREDKRDDLLSEPDVDIYNPKGQMMAPWVLSGDVTGLDEDLQSIDAELDLQEDGEKFAPILFEDNIIDGNRREAVAEAFVRISNQTGKNLRPDRKAISLLSALSSDVFAAAEAVNRLGREDERRALDFKDIRYGLSHLSADQIIPDIGSGTVSAVVRELLNAYEPLSTSELADRAGVSKRSIQHNSDLFETLEAAGLLIRDDQGDGKATKWRVRLSFDDERFDEQGIFEFVVGQKSTPTGAEWELSNALFELFTRAADDHGVDLGIDWSAESLLDAFTGPMQERDLRSWIQDHPELQPIASLLATLLDQERRYEYTEEPITLGKAPAATQLSLEGSVATAAD